MTNLEKMNSLVGANSDKKQILTWAYMNRVWLSDLPYEQEFEEMKNSVESFMNKEETLRSEPEMWEDFLGKEYIE